MIVIKFGGSSLKTAQKINQCLGIVRRELDRTPVVVVSAHGGMTDALIKVAQDAIDNDVNLKEIKEFHLRLLDSLRLERGLIGPLLSQLETILRGVHLVKDLTPKVQDHILSFGERISAVIFAAAASAKGIPAQAVNAYDVGFLTDSNFGEAAPLPDIEMELADKLAEIKKLPVITGFIGKDVHGNITTVGRNGSDYTAAILGGALDAEEIQIWTDVDGVMTADPSVDQSAMNLPVLSFDEASELAYYGAEVIHTGTLIPAVKKNIPVRVANATKPDQPGTQILPQTLLADSIAKSIVYKEDVGLINIVSPRLMSASSLLTSALGVLSRHGVGVHIAATSVASVSFVTDKAYEPKRLEAVVAELEACGVVSLEKDKAIVCVVGEEMRGRIGVLGQIFTALGQEGIKARMVSQSASELNVAFLVDNAEIEPAVKALHRLLLANSTAPSPDFFSGAAAFI